ncbi:hypothetical protein M011DRAFT_468494 [Sporormia fimetaria CBS 119925]|uniref:Inclusion body clearance protein IML2 n=1 Tax=Sporormia fimetaria CBS 119925 TaxID=1340428 RepID=A0A6A6VA47_9PLEO|nr:hypothetical protein M011DRAFT_468494 [Sporormia fimetaria CBS 119925]
MHRLGGWFGGKGKQVHHSMSLNALDEIAHIEDAMAAVTYIMADDMVAAEEHLSKGHSPFHQLGRGVLKFMRATLGFEQDSMREASEALSAAEDAAYENHRRATGSGSTYHSAIYPPGTEYAVCLAEARLMSAIVGVLNETLTEAIKSFYKMRKAFITLEGVMEAEREYVKKMSTSRLGSQLERPTSKGSKGESSLRNVETLGDFSASLDTAPRQKEKEREEDFEFLDADEAHTGVSTPQQYGGHVSATPTAPASSQTKGNEEPPLTSADSAASSLANLTLTDTLTHDTSPLATHPVDIFILSGANFCFGVLLLVISLVPPAFATLLKIVGFKGDRERGLAMLWQASRFHNIHGAMAGLVLFMFYNTFLGFCDILPHYGPSAYPKQRLVALLSDMRTRYPKSHLWLLEQGRMIASESRLEDAVEFMRKHEGNIELRQLEALQCFELSLNLMYMHEYENTAKEFERCVGLNNWSHGLYYYICGAAHVELYRRALSSSTSSSTPDSTEAEHHRAKAKEYFDKARPNLGKKKFLARQLPFDVFVARKLTKWEERSKARNLDLIDAVGVSPIEELIYFWNGYKRMAAPHLTVSLANLAWSEQQPAWADEDDDEKGVLAVLRGAVLRCLGRVEEARASLQDVLDRDRSVYKGGNKDSWTAPCARYEVAACVWWEVEAMEGEEGKRERLEECKRWLDEVAAWEAYDLDARIGLKITTAKGSLRRFGIEC